MNKFFYAHLAASNIKKNAKTYVPYTISCVLTVAVYYIMGSLATNEDMKNMAGGDTISLCMDFGLDVVAFFSVIFLFYANSFLMKRREKEFGIFNILGMEKKHLVKVVALETLYIGAASIALGLLFGIALDKLMCMVILKTLNLNIIYGFHVSFDSIVSSLILFGIIFFLIFLNSIRRVYSAKPIELLKSSNTGEKEPKAKWLFAILGAICLGLGYWIALDIQDPVAALAFFFVAVILVIIGTYLLFTAGSIVFLKLLRKNKSYYYKPNHFISVSGMIYRMKQNAVGLANICILSTMVLVMISTTSSLMVGIQDSLTSRYPYDIMLYTENLDGDVEKDIVQSEINANSLETTQEVSYNYLAVSGVRRGNEFIFDYGATKDYDYMVLACFITLDDYNKSMNTDITLDDNEILSYSRRDSIDFDSVKIMDKEYQVKEYLDKFIGSGIIASNIVSQHCFVLKNEADIDYIYGRQKDIYGEHASERKCCYNVDVTGTKEEKIQLYKDINSKLKNAGIDVVLECKQAHVGSFESLYGGLFFVGVFLGFLFTMAMILIIYYKQISEGYDDRERFVIMQKVGMSHSEVKKAIHSQIITVFFLPLIVSGIHVCFAFPMMEKIMGMFNMTNKPLFIASTAVCFGVFAIIYGIIYALTAKTYYRIVKK